MTVYCHDSADVPVTAYFQAQYLASRTFANMGIRPDWLAGNPSLPKAAQDPSNWSALLLTGSGAGRSGMRFLTRAFTPHFPGRIAMTPARREVLAYVRAHEITHILQGAARHSDEGIMQARWTAHEGQWTDEGNRTMMTRPLMFASEDVDLIHRGPAARNLRSWI